MERRKCDSEFRRPFKCRKNHRPKIVSLAVAQDEAALSALNKAQKQGLVKARLFGDRQKIQAICEKLHIDIDDFLEVSHQSQDGTALHAAVKAVRQGEADILLKGKTHTAKFLRAVLDAESGLRTGRLLSDAFIFEDPHRHGNRLLMITDGRVNPSPHLDQKVEILQNAVEVAHRLGNANPKVAVLSAIETVQPQLTSAVDAALLAKMNQRKQITGCIMDGPLALDNAISVYAAKIKNIDSPVAGQADILLCPCIESANLLAKCTTYFAGFRLAHVIMGAAAPVLIPSRADSVDSKLLSIALGVVVS
ncbi:MAG: bifunctional enoyl-CoA hydratase/phosphate acetyltransferase [bacterium]